MAAIDAYASGVQAPATRLGRLRTFLSGARTAVFRGWGYWLASLTVAILLARVVYVETPDRDIYRDFIVGGMAWNDDLKLRDLALPAAFCLGFLVMIAIWLSLAASLTARVGTAAARQFDSVLIVASIPALVWLSGGLASRPTGFDMLQLSGAAIGIAALLALGAVARPARFWRDDPVAFRDGVAFGLALALAAVFAALATLVVADRALVFLDLQFPRDPRMTIRWTVRLLGAIAIAGALAVLLAARDTQRLRRALRIALLIVQLPLPGLFLLLVPNPWIEPGAPDARRFFGHTMQPWLFVVIGVAMIAAYADWARRAMRSSRGSDAPGGIVDLRFALSPVCLVAVLVLLKTYPIGISYLRPDDYHVGEMLTPFASWYEHGLIPLWDHAPARGLVNYLPGLLGELLFDGTQAGIAASAPIRTMLVLAIAFPAIAWILGKEIAFLALFFMPPANGLPEVDTLNTAILCVLGMGYYVRWRPSVWLGCALVCGVAAVLFAPAQGGMTALALVPLGIVMLVRAVRDDARRSVLGFAALAACLVLLTLLTPFGQMFAGAIRYGLEQSSINLVANGTSWLASFNHASYGNPFYWQALRAAFVFVAIGAGVVLLHAWTTKDPEYRRRAWIFALPIFIVTFLFIARAAGRIDPAGATRLGIASIWALTLLLPVLLFVVCRFRRLGPALAVFVFGAGLWFQNGGFDPRSIFFRPFQADTMRPGLVDGASLGLAKIGRTYIDQTHLDRLQRVNKVLTNVLAKDETYLDLTNRGAHYYYFRRRPPTETAAAYNLVHPNQQLRALLAMAERPPPLALVDADRLGADGGPPGLRTHLLYRYVLNDYEPFLIGTDIWMIRRGARERIQALGPNVRIEVDEAAMVLLDKGFRFANLRSLPVSWGRSHNSLARAARVVRTLPAEATRALTGATRLGSGRFKVDGPRSSVEIDLGAQRLAGREAGLLSFDFACAGDVHRAELEIAWLLRGAAAAHPAANVRLRVHNGRLIVPLDAAPRWLLADDVASLRVTLLGSAPCVEFSIANVALSQRLSVDRSGLR